MRKPEKNNWKNQTVKKTDWNFEKTGRFGFISLKPNRTKFKSKKTEPNRQKIVPKPKNQAKPEKTEPNQKTKPNMFKPVYVLKNRTQSKPVSLNQFGFFFKF